MDEGTGHMRNVKVKVFGDLNVRISHSIEVELKVREDMEDHEIEALAIDQLQCNYEADILPILKKLEPVVAEWEVEDHEEQAFIEEEQEA